MSIAVELKPETEKWLLQEAVRRGKDASILVAETIEEKRQRFLESDSGVVPHLGPVEAELLRRINEGLPEATWTRYRLLVRKRRADTLSDAERDELLAVGSLIEKTHVNMLEHVAELARVKHLPFRQMMKELGIRPRRV